MNTRTRPIFIKTKTIQIDDIGQRCLIGAYVNGHLASTIWISFDEWIFSRGDL